MSETVRVTRQQAHDMIEFWWNPECVDEKLWRHKLIDVLFDEGERKLNEQKIYSSGVISEIKLEEERPGLSAMMSWTEKTIESDERQCFWEEEFSKIICSKHHCSIMDCPKSS